MTNEQNDSLAVAVNVGSDLRRLYDRASSGIPGADGELGIVIVP